MSVRVTRLVASVSLLLSVFSLVGWSARIIWLVQTFRLFPAFGMLSALGMPPVGGGLLATSTTRLPCLSMAVSYGAIFVGRGRRQSRRRRRARRWRRVQIAHGFCCSLRLRSHCKTRGRMLIADDEPTLLESTEELFLREGYECQAVFGGTAALAPMVDARAIC